MRMMYFAYDGFDTPNGTNHLALELMSGLLERGFDVYLLTSHSSGLSADIPDELLRRTGFTYDVVQRKSVGKKNFISRYLDGIKYAIKCIRIWIQHKNDIDVVLLQSTPTVVYSAILMHLFMKKPIIYNSYDLFPDGGYALGVIKSRLLFIVLHRIQKLLYRLSSKIVVISDDMKNCLMNQGVPKEKLIKTDLWYDDQVNLAICEKDNRFIRKYNIDTSKFYVQYAGNFGFTFDHNMVIEIAKILKNNDEIVFQMIGTGAFEEDFKVKVKNNSLNNIDFYPWQPLDIICDVYNACSIGLIPLSNGVIRNSYPSKSSLLLACGKPLVTIAESDSEYYRFINQSRVGFCTPSDQPKQAAESILMLYMNKELLKEYSDNARLYSEKNLSRSKNLDKYDALLRSIVDEEKNLP